ncbi:GIY-YIG nuclease family protein [Alysiella crassa]|uniref:Uncharacterized protein n=1 Tax=Alysiella crassa TaxID=153491 RepID=A0A376BLV1_9NEIS|nr:GIY-YIG nuclease family protein [Alysiella crassa]SSY70194.1 Uncharacterised protein [Alysiella crassa]
MKGWIYVLSNQSVPDWLAIGYADTDPAALVHQYGNSGIKLPYPFELQYALRTPYPKTLLQKIHDELAEKCVNPEHNSDWFECDLLTALRLVRKIAGHSATGEAFYGQARRLVEQAQAAEPPPSVMTATRLSDDEYADDTPVIQQVRTAPPIQRGQRPSPLIPPQPPRPAPPEPEKPAPPKEEPKWLVSALIVTFVILVIIAVFLGMRMFGYF